MNLPLNRILALILVIAWSGAACAKDDPDLEPPKDNQADSRSKSPALLPVEDTPELPRVLIIGDSISIGYTLPVRAALAGKANVHRPPGNCGATDRGLSGLDRWLGDKPWDVIYFNFGLHDLKWTDGKGKYVPPGTGRQHTSLADYEKNLHAIVQRLKKTNAKLIFATITPVPVGAAGRADEDRRSYNDVAVKVMKEEGVEISDLGGFVETTDGKFPPYPPLDPAKPNRYPPLHQGAIQKPYDVHFTDAGYARVAQEVVAPAIAKNLPRQGQ